LLKKHATITYDTGLANAEFSSGPSGGWKINSWKDSFGQDVEEWNPIQMEFYKQVKTLGLKKNETEKKKWLNKSIEDWIVEFGEMDKWKIKKTTLI